MASSVSFDRVSDIYDATRGLPPEVSLAVTNSILNIVSATPETTFLEPGIGTGRIALPIVRRGYRYTGVDISEKMLDELRRKLGDESHRLTLIKGDATALPFGDRSFDVALTVHVLHLIPNWRQALSEIRRVLKSGGVYLYTHGRMNPTNLDDDYNQGGFEFDQRWRSILADRGYSVVNYGATEQEVLDALIEQGATLETVVAAQWRVELTVGKLLDRYQNKAFSACWQVPDNIFPDAIQALREWCQQRYDSLEQDLSFEQKFKIVVVRWAASGN